jgi:hypothetical protein
VERGCSSDGSCAAPQEMENKHDQSDDQQDVDEAGPNVKCEKARQPENNQNQGDKSEHGFTSSSGGEEQGVLWLAELCWLLSEGHHAGDFRGLERESVQFETVPGCAGTAVGT